MAERASWEWVVEFLVCPDCRRPLQILQRGADLDQAILGHPDGQCEELFPVIDRIPRLLRRGHRRRLYERRREWFRGLPAGEVLSTWARAEIVDEAVQTVDRFDREWRRFRLVGAEEQRRVFARYFDVVPSALLRQGHLLLDAGCGAGRWAHQVQEHGSRVIAVDLGESVELAERNTRGTGRVACVQADIRDTPIRDHCIDLAYSLGVLHHIADTEAAVKAVSRTLREGGAMLLYLYYSLETRGRLYRALFTLVGSARGVTSRLPQPALEALTTALAACVYWPLARASRVVRLLNSSLADRIPLSFYGDLSFTMMRNDSLDRFGTRLEKRFSRADVHELLQRAGLMDVRVADTLPYWHAIGFKSPI